MTLEQFEAQFIGKRPDYDGVYGVQCVDLVKLYATMVVGSPALKGNAVELANNPQPDYYDYKSNTPLYIPPKGAIAIWNEKEGEGYGHAAIVIKAHLMNLTTLDLNWPVGEVVKQVQHRYTNIKGFLVPKDEPEKYIVNRLCDEITAVIKKYR